MANVRDNSRSSIVNITMKKCSIPNIFTPYNKFLYDFVATGNNFENQIFHCLDKDISWLNDFFNETAACKVCFAENSQTIILNNCENDLVLNNTFTIQREIEFKLWVKQQIKPTIRIIYYL